ncbi:MAG: hypothetical protein IJP92_02720 [Lachnospiraceae bacterium]|nr:hypothetical protein [Lachnospiraceae bacterium]
MRKFTKIIARNIPDDIVTYKEYAGKPYYEIMYEENGEVIVGFGTYNIDILSEWINEYFIDNKIDKVLEIIEAAHFDLDDSARERDVYMRVSEFRKWMKKAVMALKGGD